MPFEAQMTWLWEAEEGKNTGKVKANLVVRHLLLGSPVILP